MIYLLSASLIWAFSFGLIKNNLVTIDPVFVSMARIFLAFIIFLPFLKVRKLTSRIKLSLIITGAVQYGMMYIFYIYSYRYLESYEVALFTIFTPVYIALIHAFNSKKINTRIILISIVATIGAGIVIYSGVNSPEFLKGFFILQLSNICFAWGQLKYRKIMKKRMEIRDFRIFGYLYFGGFILTLAVFLLSGRITPISISINQIYTILYLGIIASGLGFFLWNLGAKLSRVGTLSIFNNIKIPLAITVSFLIFKEKGNILQLCCGGMILIFLVILSEKISFSGKR